MTAINRAFPNAFTISWENAERWDYGFFRRVRWQWPREQMARLGSVLVRKQFEVDANVAKATVPIIEKISFGGRVTVSKIEDRSGYKGRLFWADAGDLIYSKIRVKQGSLAIVPTTIPRLAVSAEYPTYGIDEKRVEPDFLALVLKTKSFLSVFAGLAHGGSTKTRIPPEEFERQEIPLPPLAVQVAIVARWREARRQIAAALSRIETIEADLQRRFLSDLGLRLPQLKEQPKAFAVWWKDLFAFSARATFLSIGINSLNLGKYPIVLGRDCLAEVRHGCSASPSPKPTGLEILKISAVTRGEFAPTEKKFAFDNKRVRAEFDLRKGDVLMCRTNGTLAYVGMSALVRNDMANLVFPDKVIRVRTQESVTPEFLWLVLQSHPIRAQIEAAARTAVGNYAIGTNDIWNLKIPLAPLPVQREIVARVQTGRAEIARERAAAARLRREITAEIEARILGMPSGARVDTRPEESC